MGEVISLVSKAERERNRLIRQAREIYDSIFPSEHAAYEQRAEAIAGHTSSDINVSREGGYS